MLFAWIKRRILKEHLKLLWQNEAVSTDPELRTRLLFHGHHDLADRLTEISNESRTIVRGALSVDGLTDDQFAYGLQFNKELRRIFEIGYQAGPSKFDPKYTPLGGWPFYYERHWAS